MWYHSDPVKRIHMILCNQSSNNISRTLSKGSDSNSWFAELIHEKSIFIPMLYFHIKKAVRSKSTITIPFKFQATHYRGDSRDCRMGRNWWILIRTLAKTLITKFMGTTWGQSGPTGPRWAPRWPHEFCYLGMFGVFWQRMIPKCNRQIWF